ncbi:MAG: cyclic nucleotide-binding domain-containing protein [bacterium]|nr:cyclic nucleotide-binding domain-containing protein [bacterium]
MPDSPSGQPPAEHPSAFKKLNFVKRELPLQLRTLIRKLQKNYTFFGDMLEDEVGSFLRLCKRDTYGPGDVVFREGDIGEEFYLIVSGEIIIRMGDRDVARLGPGQVFGEMAMLESAPRSASAIPGEGTVLFTITRKILATRMPALSYKVVVNIAKQLSEKLRESNQAIGEMNKKISLEKNNAPEEEKLVE